MQSYRAVETTWSGVPAVRLADEASRTQALILPGLGANLISLQTNGRELLRCPPDAAELAVHPTRWGTPVLMPPNRVAGGRFHFGGREYRLEVNTTEGHHIHGFPMSRSWHVQTCRADGAGSAATLVFTAAEHEDVLAQFPHRFVLALTYTLRDGALRCEAVVHNDGPGSMPFGLGFHPYFATPDPTPGRYLFRLQPESRPWELVEKIPTGRMLEPGAPADLRRWTDVHAIGMDHGFALDGCVHDSQFELQDTVSGLYLTMGASREYRHWVVFNGRRAEGFVCLEPYTCMTNAFNLPDTVAGTWVIAPGQTRRAGSWSLTWTFPR